MLIICLEHSYWLLSNLIGHLQDLNHVAHAVLAAIEDSNRGG